MINLFAYITNFWVKPKPSGYTIDGKTVTFEKDSNDGIETYIHIIIKNSCNTVIFDINLFDCKNKLLIQIPRDVTSLSFPPVPNIDLPKYLKNLSVQYSSWLHIPKYLEKLYLSHYCSYIMFFKNMRVLNIRSCVLTNNHIPKNITHITLQGNNTIYGLLPKKLYYLCNKYNSNGNYNIKLSKHIKYVHLGPYFNHKIQIPKYTQQLDTGWYLNEHIIIPETLKILNLETFNMAIIDNLPNGLEKLYSVTCDENIYNYHICNIPSKSIHIRKNSELIENALRMQKESAKI